MLVWVLFALSVSTAQQLPDNNTFIGPYSSSQKKQQSHNITKEISACSPYLDMIECEVLSKINNLRKKEHLHPLEVSKKCTDMAQEHSEYMVGLSQRGVALAQALNHDHFQKRIKKFGLKQGRVTENVAAGLDLFPQKVVKMWLRSSGHKQNIFDKKVKYTGLSAIKDSKGQVFWTQCFSSTP